MKYEFHEKIALPGMAFDGPCFVARIPCQNGLHSGDILAVVNTGELDTKTGTFTAPIKQDEYLFFVYGPQLGAAPHIIHSDRFMTLAGAKREGLAKAKAQAGYKE